MLSRCLPNCSRFSNTYRKALAEASFAGFQQWDIDWHSEIIENGASGFLIKKDDHQCFSDSVLKILNDKNLSEKFSKNIREKAEELLSPERIHKIEIECFNKIKKLK